MGRLRVRLTFPTVVVGAAVLVVGTAGTAYAADEWTGANIVDGSITSADIQNATIQGIDIAAGTVTGSDLKNNDVTGSDVKNETLASADVLDGTITGADLQDGSVDGADVSQLHGDFDIIDNTITTFDIATDAIDSDEVLDFGLTNQDVGVLFASLNGDGTVANSSGGVTAIKLGGTGAYEVNFGRDVTQCGFTATVGPAQFGSAVGQAQVADRSGAPNAVFVNTTDSAGAGADLPFHLIVVC